MVTLPNDRWRVSRYSCQAGYDRVRGDATLQEELHDPGVVVEVLQRLAKPGSNIACTPVVQGRVEQVLQRRFDTDLGTNDAFVPAELSWTRSWAAFARLPRAVPRRALGGFARGFAGGFAGGFDISAVAPCEGGGSDEGAARAPRAMLCPYLMARAALGELGLLGSAGGGAESTAAGAPAAIAALGRGEWALRTLGPIAAAWALAVGAAGRLARAESGVAPAAGAGARSWALAADLLAVAVALPGILAILARAGRRGLIAGVLAARRVAFLHAALVLLAELCAAAARPGAVGGCEATQIPAPALALLVGPSAASCQGVVVGGGTALAALAVGLAQLTDVGANLKLASVAAGAVAILAQIEGRREPASAAVVAVLLVWSVLRAEAPRLGALLRGCVPADPRHDAHATRWELWDDGNKAAMAIRAGERRLLGRAELPDRRVSRRQLVITAHQDCLECECVGRDLEIFDSDAAAIAVVRRGQRFRWLPDQQLSLAQPADDTDADPAPVLTLVGA